MKKSEDIGGRKKAGDRFQNAFAPAKTIEPVMDQRHARVAGRQFLGELNPFNRHGD
jgi:hypothetical protein